MSDELKDFKEQLEIARKQSEGAAKEWETLIKCLKIAMRIMSGDIVPKADHRYLAKNEPEMYAKAITLRRHKAEPKKHKRLSEKEEPEKAEKKDSPKTDMPESAPVEEENSENSEDSGEAEEQAV